MSKTGTSACIVKITFKRIQEFLFAVPRLKAMIGANALLGETIRNDLTKRAISSSAMEIADIGELTADDSDPLSGTVHPDDPAALYKKGILSRDGGHFHAIFTNTNDARNFIQKAEACITKQLPGVQMEASLQTLGQKEEPTAFSNMGESDTRLPQFQICQDTGTRIANTYQTDTPNYISDLVERLKSKGEDFYDKKTEEIIGLLLKAGKLPSLDENHRIPKDLTELAGASGYIAVIHADGNSMGIRRQLYADDDIESPQTIDQLITNEQSNETFFHAMRVAVRKSVVTALKATFNKEVLEQSNKLPYQLLMLGGDDLLLITRPEYAFPFVIEYAKELKNNPIPYKKDEEPRPMSIGAGIAIASHKLPFHHLYHLAENLADSAKKLYRAQL